MVRWFLEPHRGLTPSAALARSAEGILCGSLRFGKSTRLQQTAARRMRASVVHPKHEKRRIVMIVYGIKQRNLDYLDPVAVVFRRGAITRRVMGLNNPRTRVRSIGPYANYSGQYNGSNRSLVPPLRLGVRTCMTT